MTRERRHFPRIPQAFDARSRPSGEFGSGWETITVVNLGAGGIRFRSQDARLALGSLLDISLSIPGLQEALVLEGRVAWSDMQASGVTEHGVEFIRLSPKHQAQIDQLVGFLKGRV